ncbi:hypothetical protein [Salipiger bermudensis]|uniref:hypothetical protein n=1 Tax=Salipiger bermudensis TaxID=344736 RepID=UPI001CD3E2C0|nr:hypothetical protein [Salipiger bermudensis]MCA1284827.1 hypothetical protein [Salipiger bermudensis]
MEAKMWIDSVVSDDILLRQGKYVQTCAHLEKVLWHILFDANGYDLENDEHINAAFSQRKVTTKLISGLRGAIKAGQVAFPDRVIAILDEIERDIDNRHMAVHGAWVTRPDGTFTCEYFKNFGTSKKPEWRAYSAPISAEQIDEALAAADRLLGEAIKTWRAIGDQREASRATTAGIKSSH